MDTELRSIRQRRYLHTAHGAATQATAKRACRLTANGAERIAAALLRYHQSEVVAVVNDGSGNLVRVWAPGPQIERPDDDPRRQPLPPGHPVTWGAITSGTTPGSR